MVLADAAAGYGGDRRRSATGVRCAAAAASAGPASQGCERSCRPATARPRVNLTGLRRVTLAAFPSRLLAPVLADHGEAVRPGAPEVRP